MSMIKLSNGVEISEQTILYALNKAGISIEPKHDFKAGDMALFKGSKDVYSVRIICSIYNNNGEKGLYALDMNGHGNGDGTVEYFHRNDYKFIGRVEDLFKKLI